MSSTTSNLVRDSRRVGRYELLARIARGGMGEIYLARATGVQGFEKLVVIKQMLPQFNDHAAIEKLFFNEARIAAMLSHPNVCHVYELDRDGDTYYMAMEYMHGIDVAEMLRYQAKQGQLLDRGLAAALIVQACEGLHHAHELRDDHERPLDLVHRDISPANLFVTTNGIVKVLDFGIAKLHASAPQRETSQVKGKFAYMSPEQLSGDQLDRRADVFSLGIVLWELLVGSRLFKRKSEGMTVKAVLEEEIPRADARVPAVPESLADVVACALERDLGKRFASASAFGAAVAEAAAVSCPTWRPAQLGGWVKSAFSAELATQRRLRMRATSGVLAAVEATDPKTTSETARDPSLEMIYSQDAEPSRSDASMGRAAVTTPIRPPHGRLLPGHVDSAPSVITADIVVDDPDRSATGPAPAATDPALVPRSRRRWRLAALLALPVVVAFVVTNTRRDSDSDDPALSERVRSSSALAPNARSADSGRPTPSRERPVAAAADTATPEAATARPASDPSPPATRNPPRNPLIRPAKPTRTPRPKPRAKRPGKLFVDIAGDYAHVAVRARGSKRWRKLGDTPVLGATLLEGTYTLRATSSTGQSKTIRVRIKPHTSTRKKLEW